MTLEEAAYDLQRLAAFEHAPHCARFPKANDRTRFDLTCNLCKAAHKVATLLELPVDPAP